MKERLSVLLFEARTKMTEQYHSWPRAYHSLKRYALGFPAQAKLYSNPAFWS